MGNKMTSTVYLVCGVAGSGKTWVCKQLEHMIHYVPYDEQGVVVPTQEFELHDRTVHISTTIERWRAQGIAVVPVFVMGDFITVKSQLISRGGQVTVGLYKRWRRMQQLANRYSYFTGSSREVLRFLKQKINQPSCCSCIYLATFPNGKVYVGQAKLLQNRINHHKWRVNSSTVEARNAFYSAWRKHGEPTFTVLEYDIEPNQLSARECYWISYYRSNDRSCGYNLTAGGEGCLGREVSKETRDKISKANKGKKHQPFTPEVIAKLKASAKLRKLTPTSIEGIRRGQFGRKHSEEEKHRRCVRLSKPIQRSDGKTYLNAVEAAKDLATVPQAISRVLKGIFKQHKGYGFSFITDQTLIDKIKAAALLTTDANTD